MIYFDTSALIKAFVEERGSAAVKKDIGSKELEEFPDLSRKEIFPRRATLDLGYSIRTEFCDGRLAVHVSPTVLYQSIVF